MNELTINTVDIIRPMGDWLDNPGAAEREDPSTNKWYVLHTKSRQEKVVAAQLTSRGISHFLPLIPQARYYGRRKITVELPLFPSYVFLYGQIEQAYETDRTKRLARIIPVEEQHQLDWELQNLHAALSRMAPLDAHPHLKVGLRAEIRSGPFRGIQGIIESRIHPNRLLLQVEMLGRAMSLEVDGALLEALE